MLFTMTENEFINQLKQNPSSIEFSDSMGVIDQNYHFSAVAFTIGSQDNNAGENQGSCKLIAFAKHHGLEVEQTLNLFGAYYRDEVLKNPEGDDHQNIRNFMASGWDGVSFDGDALVKK